MKIAQETNNRLSDGRVVGI